jgi:biopolymer transport protein ExbB
MFYDAYINIVTFMESGGPVLNWIALATFLMWALIFERMWYFMLEHRGVVSAAVDHWEARSERNSWSAHQVRDQLISESATRIDGSMLLIQTCVALCPLLGLLGTVTGMIAVFDGMATQGGNARTMAAGVQMATIPTMAGMVASLSGLFAHTLLKRVVDREIELLEDHLTMDH